MILSLGQGEPSYVPDGLIERAHDYADVSYLAFLQCYARDLAQWAIICFFARQQDDWCTLEDLAVDTDGAAEQVAKRLVVLSDRGLLEERVLFTGLEYRLTRSPELRRLVLRLGSEWPGVPARAE
jgi:hypothetical protein